MWSIAVLLAFARGDLRWQRHERDSRADARCHHLAEQRCLARADGRSAPATSTAIGSSSAWRTSSPPASASARRRYPRTNSQLRSVNAELEQRAHRTSDPEVVGQCRAPQLDPSCSRDEETRPKLLFSTNVVMWCAARLKRSKNTTRTRIGYKVLSHASDGTRSVYSLIATSSCNIYYFTVDKPMGSGDRRVGISDLDRASSCSMSVACTK
jgi:hypothetical protein